MKSPLEHEEIVIGNILERLPVGRYGTLKSLSCGQGYVKKSCTSFEFTLHILYNCPILINLRVSITQPWSWPYSIIITRSPLKDRLFLKYIFMLEFTFNFLDDLRLAVKEVICDNQTERQKYEEAIIAITVDESLKRLGSHSFLIYFDVINLEMLTAMPAVVATAKG